MKLLKDLGTFELKKCHDLMCVVIIIIIIIIIIINIAITFCNYYSNHTQGMEVWYAYVFILPV
jgi:hypothetical protein